MSASMLNQGNLLPFRIYDEHDVIPFFSLDGTGLNGQFVAMETGTLFATGIPQAFSLGSQDPSTSAGQYSNNPVAAAYTNIISYRYNNNRKVRATQSGDSTFNALGITLHTTAEYDENGNKLINFPQDQTYERGFVLSGFSVPILTRGIVTLKVSQINGNPIPGYAGCISTGTNLGSIDVVNPTTLGFGTIAPTGSTYAYPSYSVVGKFLSTTGAGFGGYAQFKVQL